MFSFCSFSQRDFTFCYGSIALTIFDGGNAEMVRYNSSGTVVSRVKGSFDLYGKGQSTEVLKIQFQGTEYRYDLIRDGYGNPSMIYDSQMREYKICKTSNSSNIKVIEPNNDLNFFIGSHKLPNSDLIVTVSKENGKLVGTVSKNGKILSFKTSCGLTSKFTQVMLENNADETVIFLTPINCKLEIDKDSAWPVYIDLTRGDSAFYDERNPFYYLKVYLKSDEIRAGGTVKKVNHN
jgi:hypothetical protein